RRLASPAPAPRPGLDRRRPARLGVVHHRGVGPLHRAAQLTPEREKAPHPRVRGFFVTDEIPRQLASSHCLRALYATDRPAARPVTTAVCTPVASRSVSPVLSSTASTASTAVTTARTRIAFTSMRVLSLLGGLGSAATEGAGDHTGDTTSRAAHDDSS